MHSQLSREWSPQRGLIITGWILCAAAALWLILANSAVDRLFIGVLVLVLAAASAYGGVVRPRLFADPGGVTVRGWQGTRHFPWTEITFQVRRNERFGRTVESLELDLPDDKLLILTRLDLGEDPRDVAEALDEIRS